MPDHDFAIYGSGLLPAMVAGLLAGRHGRSVALISRRRSAQRLPRRIDLALPLTVRPADWSIIGRGEAEIAGLLDQTGAKPAWTECALHADTQYGTAALDHLAHMAVAHGHRVRRSAGGWSLRRVARLDAQALEALLAAWLDKSGVARLDGGTVDAATTVLAGGDDLRNQLPAELRPDALLNLPMLATLLVTIRPPEVPVMRFVDRGVTLLQQGPGLTLALVSGDTDVEVRLAASLRGPFPIKRLASTRFHRIITRDGAPLIGPLKQPKAFLIAGLGDAAPFYAPVLARLLADVATDEEKAWMAAHSPAQSRDGLAGIEVFQ